MVLLVKPAGLNPPESTNPKCSGRLARGQLLSNNCICLLPGNVETLRRIHFFCWLARLWIAPTTGTVPLASSTPVLKCQIKSISSSWYLVGSSAQLLCAQLVSRPDMSSSCCRAPRVEPWDAEQRLTRKLAYVLTQPRPRRVDIGHCFPVMSLIGREEKLPDVWTPLFRPKRTRGACHLDGPAHDKLLPTPARTLPSRGRIIA